MKFTCTSLITAVALFATASSAPSGSGNIGSWFDTNSAQDHTNGHSWCLHPYQNSDVGFA
jgi:hypothetical protein